MWNPWTWMGTHSSQINIVFTIVAAGYIIWEYQNKVHDDKVAQSMSYIQKYDEGKVFEARSNLDRFWMSDETGHWISRVSRITPIHDRVKTYHTELFKLLKQKGLDNDVYVLLKYHGSAALCVKSRHCDSETYCDFLFRDVQRYRENYKAFIERWQAELGDHTSTDIDTLLRKACTVQLADYCKESLGSPYCS